MLASSDSGVQEAFSAARHQCDICCDLLSDLRFMQDEVPHWNNESYKDGQARLADLLAHVSQEVAKLDICMVPLSKQLTIARKVGLAHAAQKRTAR